MNTVVFYSYKGGVGRSLALYHIADSLYLMGQKVFIIDLDLEAPGIKLKYLGDSTELDKDIDENGGVIDFLLPERDEKDKDGNVQHIEKIAINENSLDERVLKIRGGESKDSPYLKLLGNGRSEDDDGVYWDHLVQLQFNDLFFVDDADESVLGTLNRLVKVIEETYKPDFLLIDSRAGVTPISRWALTKARNDSNKILMFFSSNTENYRGIAGVLQLIKNDLIENGNVMENNICMCATRFSGADKNYVLNKINKIPIIKEFIENRPLMFIYSDASIEADEHSKGVKRETINAYLELFVEVFGENNFLLKCPAMLKAMKLNDYLTKIDKVISFANLFIKTLKDDILRKMDDSNKESESKEKTLYGMLTLSDVAIITDVLFVSSSETFPVGYDEKVNALRVYLSTEKFKLKESENNELNEEYYLKYIEFVYKKGYFKDVQKLEYMDVHILYNCFKLSIFDDIGLILMTAKELVRIKAEYAAEICSSYLLRKEADQKKPNLSFILGNYGSAFSAVFFEALGKIGERNPDYDASQLDGIWREFDYSTRIELKQKFYRARYIVESDDIKKYKWLTAEKEDRNEFFRRNECSIWIKAHYKAIDEKYSENFYIFDLSKSIKEALSKNEWSDDDKKKIKEFVLEKSAVFGSLLTEDDFKEDNKGSAN